MPFWYRVLPGWCSLPLLIKGRIGEISCLIAAGTPQECPAGRGPPASDNGTLCKMACFALGSRDWHDWMRNDKTMLGLLIVFVLLLWAWVREPKLFDLVNLFAGALIALITGAVLRRNGNGNGDSSTK